ncbi:type I restriction-modification system subunit M [Mycoplasmopsis caviae]|uniref:site-specific DNA-methyltransferase (adenine-specific) n=1 Tax=Mycoplasmopsis caviae TaxID=55603 RepID=A0A3P8MFA1_9BACT|nr:class I SAM-dependent DNA methyltransferase [Mycoplasmopsis caviae]UUD35072.1 type I restriction-modification system subunit M [Mycoplasmopsis caviae]VDR42103.1 Probable type I restriction enzyme BthVORF4518P M protein [Mycoplasmopsis caviae]
MAFFDENVLWDAAVKLRGSIAPSQYMNICLGLIFLKYVSEKYDKQREELIAEGFGLEDDDDAYIANNVLIIPNEANWREIAKFSKTEEIGEKIDNAFILIEKKNPELNGILPKIYATSSVDKSKLGDLFEEFSNHLKLDLEDGDFIGKTYEYFMGRFARKLGEKGGEFFTPKCIVDLLIRMLDPKVGRIYDPCCGSGGMFVQTSAFLKQNNQDSSKLSIYGQELNAETWRIAKLNLIIRGLMPNLGTSAADTFKNDMHKNIKFDYIIANPPFNIKDYYSADLEADPRWEFGPVDPGNANYAWIQHMYSKLNHKGIAGFVMANGSLSTSDDKEVEIRKNMLEAGVVDAIVSLPTKLFYTTGVPACLWFLRKNKGDKNVLFIDARELGTLIDKKSRELTQQDIEKISSTYLNWKNNSSEYKDVQGFCKVATFDEIKENDYSLVPGRYVGFDSEPKMTQEELKAKIKESSQELLKLFEESAELEKKVVEILKKNL